MASQLELHRYSTTVPLPVRAMKPGDADSDRNTAGSRSDLAPPPSAPRFATMTIGGNVLTATWI